MQLFHCEFANKAFTLRCYQNDLYMFNQIYTIIITTGHTAEEV